MTDRIGIDLGGTKIEGIRLAINGEVSQQLRVATPSDNYEQTLAAIASIVTQLEADANQQLSVGIGTPGAISAKTGLMKNSNSVCLNDKPLREDLESILNRPIRIANDADCFALSEASDGAAADVGNMFGVIMGTGVGGGICINQQLISGPNAIAGEWGHNPLPLGRLVDKDPEITTRQCYCGRSDCVESWLSGPSLEGIFAHHHGSQLPAKEIAKLADHDPVAHTVLMRHHHMLALALSNVINILDPHKIVIGGGLSNLKTIYEEVPSILPQYVFSDRVDTQIVPAKYGDASGVRGAAWLWS